MDFKAIHPAGSLGAKLKTVEDLMIKGKKIPFDFKSSLRPTSSKLREVLFNWLQFEIQDYQCLDLFSGTGALGIEAISRGAERTVFIESNKKNFLALKRSISDLNLKTNSIISEVKSYEKY